MAGLNQLTRGDHWHLFWRSFYIQTGWNFKTLIGNGFCFCLVPVARKLFRTPEGKKSFFNRHLAFFNAHPYFASYALGAVLRLEEEAVEDPGRVGMIVPFKEKLTGPLGAIGDRIFWELLKPLTALVGGSLILLDKTEDYSLSLLGLFLFLAGYNLPHLWVRFRGIKKGYVLGINVLAEILSPKYPRLAGVIGTFATVMAGLFIIVGGQWSLDRGWVQFMVFISSGTLGLFLLKRASFVWALASAFGMTLVWGWLGTVVV